MGTGIYTVSRVVISFAATRTRHLLFLKEFALLFCFQFSDLALLSTLTLIQYVCVLACILVYNFKLVFLIDIAGLFTEQLISVIKVHLVFFELNIILAKS